MAFWNPSGTTFKNIPVSIRSSEGQAVYTIILKNTPDPDLSAYIVKEQLNGMHNELWVSANELSNFPI